MSAKGARARRKARRRALGKWSPEQKRFVHASVDVFGASVCRIQRGLDLIAQSCDELIVEALCFLVASVSRHREREQKRAKQFQIHISTPLCG